MKIYLKEESKKLRNIFKTILAAFIGGILGAGIVNKVFVKKIEVIERMSNKHLALFIMMNQWVKVKQKGEGLAEYLKKEGYKNIAVYGMSYAGETLVEELKNTDILIAYGIDKGADSMYSEIDVISPDEKLPKVDAIVVTAITFFDEIEEMLSKKIDCPIISLEDILYEI